MGWKERAGWAALAALVMTVIAGTVTIPEPVKQFARLSLDKGRDFDYIEMFQGPEILPERSGLQAAPPPKDADIDAALYDNEQNVGSTVGGSELVPTDGDPAS